MNDVDPNVEKIKQQKMMDMMKAEEPSKFERGKVHVLDSSNFDEFMSLYLVDTRMGNKTICRSLNRASRISNEAFFRPFSKIEAFTFSL